MRCGRLSIVAVIGAVLLPLGVVAVAADQRMVRVGVHDDTKSRRIPPKAELWLKGKGSVWLHQVCDRLTSGDLSCGPLDLGMREVEQPLELVIYPDGRAAERRIQVRFKVTRDMCAAGCARDMITVEISDREVTVYGAPVVAAGATDELKWRRK